MNMRRVIPYFMRELPFFIAIPALLWQILFLYGPLLVLAYTAFYHFSLLSHILTHTYFIIVGKSLLLALSNTVACLLCAYPIAYFIAVHARHKNLLIFLLLLPFWTGMLVLIHGWFFVLEKHGLINSLLVWIGAPHAPYMFLNRQFAISLVMLYCYLPFMVMPIYSVLEKLDRRLLEASFDLGAGHWTTMMQVTIPLSMPGIITGCFLVFVPSFGEFVIPELMGGGKQWFIGSLITHYFLQAQSPVQGALCATISMLVLGSAATLLYGILHWWAPRNYK